jgi:hypothetical protein
MIIKKKKEREKPDTFISMRYVVIVKVIKIVYDML